MFCCPDSQINREMYLQTTVFTLLGIITIIYTNVFYHPYIFFLRLIPYNHFCSFVYLLCEEYVSYWGVAEKIKWIISSYGANVQSYHYKISYFHMIYSIFQKYKRITQYKIIKKKRSIVSSWKHFILYMLFHWNVSVDLSTGYWRCSISDTHAHTHCPLVTQSEMSVTKPRITSDIVRWAGKLKSQLKEQCGVTALLHIKRLLQPFFSHDVC